MNEIDQRHVPGSALSKMDFDPDTIFRKKAENGKQAINRLPPELLSRIFTVGDEEQRSNRMNNAQRYYGFQDLVVVRSFHFQMVYRLSNLVWQLIANLQSLAHCSDQ